MKSVKHELSIKYEDNEDFQKQMIKAEQNYKILKQSAHYSDLSTINENTIKQFSPQGQLPFDIFFVYGMYFNEQKISMSYLTSYFVTAFKKPKKPYVFVFFNDFDAGNNFNNFKNMLNIMPLDYFVYLQAIYLVRASLKTKASKYFSFGTINKYVNNKTIYLSNVQQLSKHLKVKSQQIINFLPTQIKNRYLIQQNSPYLHPNSSKPISSPLVGCNLLSKDHSPKSQSNSPLVPPGRIFSNKSQQPTHKVENMIPAKMDIDQYKKSQRGIPQVLQVLVQYFREHKDQLDEQGLFRKSVNIQEETLAIQKMRAQDYDFLEKEKDPHLVANLIKRFFSKLKEPIIPYDIFETLMNTENLTTDIILEEMMKLQKQNLTKYCSLCVLLDFLSRKVALRSHKNKMTVQNIAICFAPCLMWAQQRSIKDLTYINKSVAVTTIMMNNFEEIFGGRQSLKKIYRSSYFVQRKKSIAETYRLTVQNEPTNQHRKTPNFGELLMQKTIQQMKNEDHSDLSADDNTHKKINPIKILSPNRNSRSHVDPVQLKQDQKEQFLNNSQKSSEKVKSSKSNQFQILEPPKNTQKKGIFTSNINGAQKHKYQITVSPTKGNSQIKSIHSDRQC